MSVGSKWIKHRGRARGEGREEEEGEVCNFLPFINLVSKYSDPTHLKKEKRKKRRLKVNLKKKQS